MGCQRGKLEVAIKMLKHHSSNNDKIQFLKEAAIMMQFKHCNVVSMYGVVSDEGQVGHVMSSNHVIFIFVNIRL